MGRISLGCPIRFYTEINDQLLQTFFGRVSGVFHIFRLLGEIPPWAEELTVAYETRNSGIRQQHRRSFGAHCYTIHLTEQSPILLGKCLLGGKKTQTFKKEY